MPAAHYTMQSQWVSTDKLQVTMIRSPNPVDSNVGS